MAQFEVEKILRRAAVLTQTAWPDVVGRAHVGRPRTLLGAPEASAVCPDLNRVDELVNRNSWDHQFTVYGRFPVPTDGTTIEQAKDQRANDLYGALVPAGGRFYDADDNLLLRMFRCDKVDRKDYKDEVDSTPTFDIALTFSGRIDKAA